MKVIIWLTTLQVLAVDAMPFNKRQVSNVSSTVMSMSTVNTPAPVASLTIIPTSTVDDNGNIITTEITVTGTVRESTEGHSSVSNSFAAVGVSTNCPKSDSQVTATSSFPSDSFAAVSSITTAGPESTVLDLVASALPSGAAAPSREGVFFASVMTSSVTAKVSAITTWASYGTAQVLPPLSTQSPQTSGIVLTSLNGSSHPTEGPLIDTSISAPTTTISAPTTTTSAPATTTSAPTTTISAAATTTSAPTTTISAAATVSSITNSITMGMLSEDIFQPVATDAPPSVIGTREDHPVPRLGIQNQRAPIGTNKFYANFFLGSQTAGTWTHPYSLAWSKGGGSSHSWGMSIQHIDDNQKIFGPDPKANPVQYFINPIGIQSIVLSALELGDSTTISMDSLTASSANVNLLPSAEAAIAITFPLVQGMGFVTGIFNGSTPILQTGIFFRSITKAPTNPKPNVTKYTILLDDGKTWLLYAYSPTGLPLQFTVVDNGLAQATSNFNGIIQIAKDPGNAEALYDAACGAYPTSSTLSGNVDGTAGSYSMGFSKGGMADTELVMFALPHHVESFSPQTAARATNIKLSTTTKGQATAVQADSWTMVEALPTTMGFAPWSPSTGALGSFSAGTIAAIHSIAANEVSENMKQQTDLSSMYFSGKALAKFAGIVYTIHDLLRDTDLAQAGLNSLKDALSLFVANKQQFPLVYETAWGGIVSSASYVTGDPNIDFGNTYYNDHHFHYGYFIYTAAVIGHLDPSWLPANAPWVNALVRDIANPSPLDPYFPVSRNFDWYHGHSWAHGLYESFDGKDEESSSEDSMSAYAIKLWGSVIGDTNLEARGNLQLAITARSLQNYFLYTDSNTIQPAQFIGNRVSGILFENKIDHTTYFGTSTEFIQGIHMIPILPSSTLTRTKEFVQQEWDTYFSNGRADNAQASWRSILYANLAIINPEAAWQYFIQAEFDASWLDGGASRTWYLAFAAGLGGAP